MRKIMGTNELGTYEHGKIGGANELCKEHGKVRGPKVLQPLEKKKVRGSKVRGSKVRGSKVLQPLEIAGTKVPQKQKLQLVARLIRERIH
jgi:hypothetical protein